MNNYKLTKNSHATTLTLTGDVKYDSLPPKLLLSLQKEKSLIIDLSGCDRLDYAAAMLLDDLKAKMGQSCQINEAKFTDIFKFIRTAHTPPPIKHHNIAQKLADFILAQSCVILNMCAFLGETFVRSLAVLLKPSKLRLRAISNIIATSGIGSLTTVCVTSFMIGIVLAYIGADMLSQFGASSYIIDIMGIISLREVAPLLAAIVVAGQSASSFTASIGAMRVNEEIDAMSTMGFEPFYFITLPRVLAMIVAMPLIIIAADAASVLGQMIVANKFFGFNFTEYIYRFREAVGLNNFFVGLIKAPFFGAVIAMIGCINGLNSSAENIGTHTTKSVVSATFLVIALDALFAIIFLEIGI
ncbi:ABC transporter permease [Campylobacter sp. 19-13652]|uniref:MlaE family ABC transporter permease n=1 Tax=Campylobacter sp. 19-13652 TaxID=2840180 RepID=UPI001C77F971|nr:ABC transporter permease [Campylobacter sp. 19-13652]BCX78986.1 hypothetical protein LBC_04480 [Campylobacter sp. 19-13652]